MIRVSQQPGVDAAISLENIQRLTFRLRPEAQNISNLQRLSRALTIKPDDEDLEDLARVGDSVASYSIPRLY